MTAPERLDSSGRGRADGFGGPGAWALVASVVLLVHGLAISFTNDDAFISFRYARSWAEGNGLVFNVGERVEGYTNFLWTLLIGILMRSGVEPLLSSRVMGFLASVGTLVLAARLSLRLAPAFRRVRLAPILLAASSPFAYWTFAGLETPLFAFLLLLAVERSVDAADRGGGARSPLAPLSVAIPLGLLALTRPEGVPIFALFLAARLVAALRSGRFSVREEGVFVLGFLAIYGPYFAWRFSYYGFFFPNTFYLRQGRSLAENLDLWKSGALYVAAFLRDCGGALLLAPLLLIGRRSADRLAAALGALVAGWSLYVVWVGGDAKILYRFFVPVLPLLLLLAEAGLARLLTALARETDLSSPGLGPRAARSLGALGVVLLLATPSMMPPEKYHTDRTFFAMLAEGGRWLARHAPADATVACFAVGALPYYSGLTTYDLLGVTDTVIAHGPLLKGQMAGHGKMDWDYVLSRRPTFVFPMGDPDLSRVGYEYAPISVEVEGEVLTLRAWRRIVR